MVPYMRLWQAHRKASSFSVQLHGLWLVLAGRRSNDRAVVEEQILDHLRVTRKQKRVTRRQKRVTRKQHRVTPRQK
jgi:hypothetical protein